MGKIARKHVEDHFTLERMVEGYESIYKKILGNKN
jgi:glycosyltransferase involved in cell wall biosynthesis